jgi:hypothetical protein
MSFNELGISIVAQNLASAEFSKVASDAGAMATEVSSQRMSINAENLASPQINQIAEDAARVKADVEASPVTLDVSNAETAKVTFAETGVAALEMGENVGTSGIGFATLGKEAASTTVSLRTVAGAFSSVTMMGSAVISLAGDFGMVDKETAKWARTILAVITVVSTMIRLKSYLTVITTGHTAAIAINTTAESANASQSILLSVAYKIKAAATWIATAAQNALNISHATFLALTGVGIAVIIAAAVAMAYFASQMNAATSSVQSFNSAADELPSRSRSIQRAGEADLYRRGVE